MKKCFFFTLLIFCSCSKIAEDIRDTKYEAAFAVPVIKDASVGFIDLWQNDSPKQSLVVEADGRLVFRYQSDPVSVTTTDILGNLDFPIISGLADTVSKLPFQLPADIEIEEAVIASGTVFFQYKPTTDPATEITFILPSIKSGGQPLKIRASGANGATVPFDLTGYTFEPTGNFLEIQYMAKDSAGNPVILQSAGIIARPVLRFLKGTWGREEFQLPTSTIAIDLFDERFLNGNLRFTEPTITANIESSFGVPIRSRVDILNAFTKKGKMTIDASAIDGVDINYPRLEERGKSKQTVLQVDYTNSNIVEVFDAQLTEVEYGLTAIANPTNNRDLTVFLEDTSTFKAEVLVEVPVVGSTSGFNATEQFEVNFEEIEAISEGEVKLVVDNGLPVGATLQFYFLQANTIVDSLFSATPELVAPAEVGQNGIVTKKVTTTTFIPLTSNKVDALLQSEEIQVKAAFQTANDGTQDVVIKADQRLSFRMGLKFK